MQTVTLLKNDFKKEESINIDREIALEKKIKQLDNIKAQQLEPKLYDGNVIKNTSAIVIPDSEETLVLAEESHFETRFVPQTELSAEQAFWSQNSMNSSDPTPSCRPTKVEVPKELPKLSMVNTSLKKLKHHLASFDVAVEQHRLESKTFEVKMNKVLNENERLLEQVINKDIVNIIMNSTVDNASVNVHECEKCLKLETELLNKKDFIEKDTYDKLENYVSNQSAPSFEQYFELNELKAQSQEKDTVIKKLKERIKSLSENINEDKVKQDIEEIETINIELDHRVSKLIAENEHLKQTYKQLYDSIKPTRIRSKEQCDALVSQVNQKSVEISDLNVSLQEKDLVITALKNDLRKLKGKASVDNVVTKHTIAPEMLKIDVQPINPRLLNNRTAHSDYLKHTQEEAAILREIVEQGKSQNPLNNSLDSACKYTKQIQELLIIIGQTCPSINNSSAKLVAITPKNKYKRVRFTEPITSSGNTITKTASLSNPVSNKPMLSSTGVKQSTSTSGSQLSGNTKKDKIQQTPSCTQKNKVEARPMTVKSSMKNKNCFVEPKGNANVQHSKLNANSELLCVKCNGCMLSDNHDFCVLDFINDVNARTKSKSVKKIGNVCPLTRIITTDEVSLRKPSALESDTPKPIVTLVYSRKPKKFKTNVPISKPKIIKSISANKKEPSKSWGSIVSDVPSSSFDECRHNLFSVGQLCDSNLEVAFRQHTCFIRNLEGVDLLTGSRGNNLYTLSLGDMMASSPICLLSKASKTKSWLWHRRLSHLNFGAINHLARHGLVRGLPKLKFEKDHLCSACAMGKSKKKPHKPKSEDTNQEKLYLLHMDLCGPMRVASVNGKKYILVIVDDYSRFTWVKCLRSKDEAPDFIIKFLKMIQVQLKVPGRIRTDNGTEFVNQNLREYYQKVGISHETSVALSPQQNFIVERNNRTLIEATRTMLIYAKALLFLWAEAVTTACYTQNRSFGLRHGKTPYDLLHDKLTDLSFFYVFGALCYPTNDSGNLGKLQPKADIGIFIGYAPTKKAIQIYNRRTRRIIETIHVDFDELTAMASEHSSLEPALPEMTPATISSGVVPNPPPSTPCVPPSRTNWDILFQPLFDELLNPPSSVDHPAPEVIAPIAEVVALEPSASTDSPSSTTVNQDAPSPNNIIGELSRPVSTRLKLYEQALFCYYDAFLTSVEPKNYKDALTQACWIEAMQDELNEFKRLKVWELVSRPDKVMVITLKWIYKTAFLNDLLREKVYVSQPDGFVDQDNLNHVYKLKKALYGLKQASHAWYDLLSKFLLSQEFSKGTVDPTLFIRRQGKDILLISQSPRGIFINQSKYALESLKKYGMESSDPVDTPMVEKSKLDEDTQGKAVDPTHYRGMVGTLMYLTASRPDLTFVVCMCARRSTSGSMQLLGDRLVRWSSKRQKSDAISSTKAKYIALSGCCAQVLRMRSHLTDYGLGFNKISMYHDNKSAIALCCNNVQHSRSKHIDIKFHFVKEQVKNVVVELYFVNTEYQLANIFTKALGRERIEFLINKLGMRSFTPETLKQLADEAEE
ncbi:retrovirus-related pol polyprotein from transposon TNT 1-94 [Tanacetum coccineum]